MDKEITDELKFLIMERLDKKLVSFLDYVEPLKCHVGHGRLTFEVILNKALLIRRLFSVDLSKLKALVGDTARVKEYTDLLQRMNEVLEVAQAKSKPKGAEHEDGEYEEFEESMWA